MIIITNRREILTWVLEDIIRKGEKTGLKMIEEKTKIMKMGTKCERKRIEIDVVGLNR